MELASHATRLSARQERIMREGLELSKAHRQEAMRFMLQAIARAGNEIQTAEAVRTLSIDPTHKEAWWEELARAHGRDVAVERPSSPVDSYERYLDYVVGGVDCELRDDLLRGWSAAVQSQGKLNASNALNVPNGPNDPNGPTTSSASNASAGSNESSSPDRPRDASSRMALLLGYGAVEHGGSPGSGAGPTKAGGPGALAGFTVASDAPDASVDDAMMAIIPQRFSEREALVCVQARKVFDVRLEVAEELRLTPAQGQLPPNAYIGYAGDSRARPKSASREEAQRQFVEGAPSLEWTRFFSHLPLPMLMDVVRREPFELKVVTARTGDLPSDTATHISWSEGLGAKRGLRDAVFYIASQYGAHKGLRLDNADNWLKLQESFNGPDRAPRGATSYALPTLPALEMLAEWEQTGFTSQRTVLGAQTVRLRSRAMAEAVSRGTDSAHQTVRVIHGATQVSDSRGGKAGARESSLAGARTPRVRGDQAERPPSESSMKMQLFGTRSAAREPKARANEFEERRVHDPFRARVESERRPGAERERGYDERGARNTRYGSAVQHRESASEVVYVPDYQQHYQERRNQQHQHHQQHQQQQQQQQHQQHQAGHVADYRRGY